MKQHHNTQDALKGALLREGSYDFGRSHEFSINFNHLPRYMRGRKRVSRKSAASEAIFTCDALKSMCGKHTTLIKTNGSLDRHAMYMTRNGVKICVVLREWELPKGNWHPAANIGRYKVYFHKNQLT